MNRLTRELRKQNIIFEADDYKIMRGAEYDVSRELITITDRFIVAIEYSAVLDPVLYLFDRNTYEPVCVQDLYPGYEFFGMKATNPWSSFVLAG